VDPAALLQRDDVAPEVLALALVGALVRDVVEGEAAGVPDGTPAVT